MIEIRNEAAALARLDARELQKELCRQLGLAAVALALGLAPEREEAEFAERPNAAMLVPEKAAA